jgi:hypothetical protein
MNINYHGPIIILLYIGANPFTRFSDGRSAFAIALGKKDHPPTNLFLAEAWGRRLLSVHETLCLWSAMAGNEINNKLAGDTWLASCCSNIMMTRTKMLEDRVAGRLSAVTRQCFQLEPEWRYLTNRGSAVGPDYLIGFGASNGGKMSTRNQRAAPKILLTDEFGTCTDSL